VPAVALSDEELEPQLATAQSRMGAPLPPALRWLYSRLGVSGRRLFQQDPIVHLESLMVDEDCMRADARVGSGTRVLAALGDSHWAQREPCITAHLAFARASPRCLE
jgi:hypothetical protein